VVVGFLTAAETAAAVAAGDVGAAESVDTALRRAERAATLNAFTLLDEQGARHRAGQLDESGRRGPLAGVPVAVKDLIDQAGLPTTCGSSFYEAVPPRSATVVDRLEEAGAVIVGRTGLHEFAFGFSSENPWWGPVRNPWDPETSPGGSSGGSGAAVAAGIVPAALGTDTGGSVRVPAALCGLVGLKPTHGRVPLTGVFPLVASIDTVGPITRTVADASLMYRIIAGDDPTDPWSAPLPVEEERSPRVLPSLRFAVPHPWVDRPCDEVVGDGFGWALAALAEAGAEVHHIDLPQIDPPGLLSDSIGAEVALVHGRWATERPERYGRDVLARVERCLEVDAGRAAKAMVWRASVRTGLERALRDFDVLVTPAAAVHVKRLGVDTVETAAGPESHLSALSWFTAPVNHAGLPAIAVPLAAPGSPPPSLQLIGPAWGEAGLLAVARSLESAGMLTTRAPHPRR
jgi:Asp-tRNA(Asn)/Glu-tRNA(Gln) amidotransferase A subunit family amidase